MQLEFKRADRKTLKAATVKGKGNETEQLPLYTNKDSVVGEVRPAFVSCKAVQTTLSHWKSNRLLSADSGSQHSRQKGRAPRHQSPTLGPDRAKN